MMNPAGDPDAPDLSWVVPMYRTSAFVEELCERISQASLAAGLTAELVLVDDACPENSAARVRHVQIPFPVQVLRLARNFGQDGAIRIGLRACRGRHAMILDGDLQDPPEALAAMWPELARGFDAVFANRFGDYEARGRLITSRLYRGAVRVLGRLPAGAGLFVLMNRRIVDSVVAAGGTRCSILAAIAGADGQYASIPVRRGARSVGNSAYGPGHRLARAVWSLGQIIGARMHRSRSRRGVQSLADQDRRERDCEYQ